MGESQVTGHKGERSPSRSTGRICATRSIARQQDFKALLDEFFAQDELDQELMDYVRMAARDL